MAPPVVVSMTTIPRRNGSLGPTIASLYVQSLRPSEIRLYVSAGCALVPQVHCVRVDDHGPITKLSAVVDPEVPSGAIVVTADDDQIYAPSWLETLHAAATRHPTEAVGLSGWNVGGFLRDPKRGKYEWLKKPGLCDVLEGFAGVAYRKNFFASDIMDVPPLCRMVDDVWISGYLFRRGVKRRVVGPKLQRPATTDRQGLHTRSDFVDLNRRAACFLF